MGDSAVHRPAPSATGTLAKTPLVHLLLYMLDKKLSGTLELTSPDRKSVTVLFAGGQPAKVRTSEPVAYLGRVLHEQGVITEEQLTRSLADLAREKASGRKLHGEVLATQRVIDETQLSAGLREQVSRKLRHAAGMTPDTVYGYFDGFDALSGWGREASDGFDPLPTLWTMLREFPPWEQVSAALDSKGGSAMRLRGTDVKRLGLTGQELQAVELLRARPLRASELAKAAQLNERTGHLLAYLLLMTKQVELLPSETGRESAVPPAARAAVDRPPTPAPATRPASAREASQGRTSTLPGNRTSVLPVPPGMSEPLAERWKEITTRAATIDRADYYSMLDVPRDATREEVETAYLGLAKLWHPDRLPPELGPIRDACARVFARMSEARSTLADPEQRERYTKLANEGSGSPETQETVARVVEASTSFQKAEVCFKRNDLAQAEEFARRALELDDTQPDYVALLAWLTSLKPENQGGEETLQCIRTLDKAVQMSNRCEKAYFWRGMLYKRIGKSDMAHRDFKKAVELNARNIDAAREVRLFNMRSSSGRGSVPPPPPANPERSSSSPKGEEKGGLFGRLFKKT